MSKIPYTKKALTYQQQLQQLKSRGLSVANEPKALHLLENISYYRLSGYWYALLADKVNHRFKPGASFETAFKLYCFDRELRRMVISELEKIEVAVRSKMIYILSHKYGAFWGTNAQLFANQAKYAKTLKNIKQEYGRSDEQFLRAFHHHYNDPIPPSWMTLEITSFGTLSILYENLIPGQEKRNIANYFGVRDTVFISWLHSIVYIRNICAHHSRLWNRTLGVAPMQPQSPQNTWLSRPNVNNKKTYFILCMIRYLLQTVNPNTSFTTRLKKLLADYPEVDASAIGFTPKWETEQLWK